MRAPHQVALSALLALVPASCTTPDPFLPNEERNNSVIEQPVGTPIALPSRVEFAEIARLAELRSTGEGRLLELLTTSDAPVRARAAEALGRFPLQAQGDEITEALCMTLEDSDPAVRRSAAFAIGQRGDSSASGVLARHWHDPDASVRAALVGAGARIGEEPLKEDLLRSLQDPDLSVRLEAIAGMANWKADARDAGRIDGELLGMLDPRTSGGTSSRGPGPEETWLTLYSLSRRKAARGRAAFLQHVDDVEVNARLFATRGLARLEAAPGATRALERRAGDTDWRVAVEAIRGLAAHKDPASLPALEAALRHPSTQVRRLAVESFAQFDSNPRQVLDPLLRSMDDRSPAVQAAALESAAILGDNAFALPQLRLAAEDPDETLRAGAAAAFAHLSNEETRPLLERLVNDESHLVAGRALESLGVWGDETSLARLRFELDGQPDVGRRLAALLALEPHASELDLAHLERAFDTSVGDVAPELAWNAMRHCGRIGGNQARALLERGLRYQHPYVRQVANEELTKLLGNSDASAVNPPPAADPVLPPLPGEDYPAWTRNPLVQIHTSRGPLVFELYPENAPVHVYNFLELISQGAYDNLTFHRVEPNFVIQGGDPRGDGNGGLDWRGGTLRSEFSQRKFLRGSLGMPRSEYLDSGGSQFFVTHRPTPHLDGLYTLFGQLVRGFEVLDLIEPGDRIVSAERLPEPRPTLGQRFGAPLQGLN